MQSAATTDWATIAIAPDASASADHRGPHDHRALLDDRVGVQDHGADEPCAAVDLLPAAHEQRAAAVVRGRAAADVALDQREQAGLVAQVDGGPGQRHVAPGHPARREPAPELRQRHLLEGFAEQGGHRQQRRPRRRR